MAIRFCGLSERDGEYGRRGGTGVNSSTGNTVLTNLWNHLWRRRVGFVQLYFSRQQKRNMRQRQEVALLEIISVAQIVGSGDQRVAGWVR